MIWINATIAIFCIANIFWVYSHPCFVCGILYVVVQILKESIRCCELEEGVEASSLFIFFPYYLVLVAQIYNIGMSHLLMIWVLMFWSILIKMKYFIFMEIFLQYDECWVFFMF